MTIDKKNIRLLILSRFESLAGSTRLRYLQYQEALRKNSFYVEVSPLFSNDYVKSLYAGKGRKFSEVFSGYWRRVCSLIKVKQFDVVWIEKEMFPFLPSFMERALSMLNVPYVVDYDDAIFHQYDQHSFRCVRMILGSKLLPLVRSAYAVSAGNEYLVNWAYEAGAKRVELIPTVADLARYSLRPLSDNHELRLGWIGTPLTFKYIDLIREPLEDVARKIPIRFITIGAKRLEGWKVTLEQYPWSEENENRYLQKMDVGIMPLPDEPWERGKCGYKLIQYMACGIPFIASPVGTNVKMVKTSNAGILANTNKEWVEAFMKLADNPALRQRMGAAGRKAVEECYSLQAMAPRIIELLSAAASKKKHQ